MFSVCGAHAGMYACQFPSLCARLLSCIMENSTTVQFLDRGWRGRARGDVQASGRMRVMCMVRAWDVVSSYSVQDQRKIKFIGVLSCHHCSHSSVG